MRKRNLGGDKSYHEAMASERLKHAEKILNGVDDAARKKNCAGVWDGLIAAMANVADANANLDAVLRPSKTLSDRHSDLYTRIVRLRSTLGFQCTRRRGGIR